MALRTQWPDILEEEAYLVQLVSETPQDSGVLEQTTDTLDILRTDLKSCASKLADLEREIRDNEPKGNPSTPPSSASRFLHRITESISSDSSHEEKEREQEVQGDKLLDATTRERTLRMEVKNLEAKTQVLRRRIRHHEEVKHRLKELYDRVFDGSKLSSPEEDAADKDVRKAQQSLHQTQKVVERHRTLMALLGYGDFALSNAEPHLSTAALNGKNSDPVASQAEVNAAKTYIVQAYIVVHQAKLLDPNFFEQEKSSDLFQAHWVSSVFRGQRKPAGKRESRESPLVTSQQVLESYHSNLVSLLNLARKRWQEHETNLRHATQLHLEAFGRKQALRKRVLLRFAGMNDDNSRRDTEAHKGGLARMKDITAGLDKLIVPFKPQVLQSDRNEEKGRVHSDGVRGLPNREPRPLTPNSNQRSPSPSLSFYSFPQLNHEEAATRSRQPRPSTPNSMQKSPSPNLAPDPFPQSSSRLSPADTMPHLRHPRSESPLRPAATDGRAGPPELRPAGPNRSRSSLDSRPEDSRGTAEYSSSRAPSFTSSGSRFVEPHAHEARPTPTPPSDTQAKAVGLSPASNASFHPQVQSSPSTTSRAEDVSSHAVYAKVPPGGPQVRSSLPETHSPKRIKGILKAPTMAQPLPPTDLSDPWGVQIASAGPSRPRPKIKNMIGMLRGVEGFKPSSGSSTSNRDPGKSAASSSAPVPRPSQESINGSSNRWTSVQKLRFSETVVVIPRPAVDSDPYEDEDEEHLPPSPTRGSLIWHKNGHQVEDEDEEDGGLFADVAHLMITPVQPDNTERKLGATHSSNMAGSVASDHPGKQPPAPLSSRELLTNQQSHAPRPLPDMGKMSSDDMRVPTHRGLAVPDDARSRLMSPSDSNLAVQARKPAPLAPVMTRGGPETRSDHDLVQTIFPSPRATIAERDLMFTTN